MKNESRPLLENLACANPECQLYGLSKQGNLKVRKMYGKDNIRYLGCSECGEEFSERKGTALWNSKIAESKAISIAEHLSEGNSNKSTARLVGSDVETVRRMGKRIRRHGRAFHDQQVKGLACTTIEADERWGFAGSKDQQNWEGEILDPQSKLVIEQVQGERNEQMAEKLLQGAKSRLQTPDETVLMSDGWPPYATCFPKVFGRPYQPPRSHRRGRPPKHRYRISRKQAHVQVVKQRQGNRVVQVDIRMAHGYKPRVQQELTRLGYNKANTSAIERRNGTARSMDSYSIRKSIAFARTDQAKTARGVWAMNVYNWVRPHRSLRQPLPIPQGRKLYQPRTPAMAAGLTDHIWSVKDILTHQVFPHRGWI